MNKCKCKSRNALRSKAQGLSQSHNSRAVTIDGNEFKSLAAACRAYDIDYNTVQKRVHVFGWTLEDAVTTPPQSVSKVICLPDGSVFKSIKDLAKELGFSASSIYN